MNDSTRSFAASFENVAVSALQDFFELAPAANVRCKLLGAVLSQVTDVGDANEEMLRVAIIRGNTTSGSGGSAATEIALDPDAPAATAAVETNNTTEASAGTELTAWAETFNIRTGWIYQPTPEQQIIVANAQLLVVRLLVAPGSAINMSGTIIWQEGA